MPEIWTPERAARNRKAREKAMSAFVNDMRERMGDEAFEALCEDIGNAMEAFADDARPHFFYPKESK